jgi:ribonuclease HI
MNHPPHVLPPQISSAQDISNTSNTYPSQNTLLWTTHPALYSDGSCHTDPRGRTIQIGAGFYCPAKQRRFLVAPRGQNETNTITRAELAAIWACLSHASDDSVLSSSPLTIFTDSLASLHLIDRTIKDPASLDEKIHLPLLLAIKDLLLTRARKTLPTLLQKVKSHSGIQGNDEADIAAKHALTSRQFDYTTANINNQ